MHDTTLADAIKYGFSISHSQDGWITPLTDAVAHVDAATARYKPAPDVPSIWELTAHALPYTEALLDDLEGISGAASEDWPGVTDTSDQAWSKMQADVARVTTRLQQQIEGLSTDQLCEPPKGKKTVAARRIMDMVVHDAYHAGQVVKLAQIRAAATESLATA